MDIGRGRRTSSASGSGASSPPKDSLTPPIKDCLYYKGTGHTTETCFKRIADEQRSKKVNLCQNNEANSHNTIMRQIGQNILQCIFDSRADFSLIQESVALHIPGQRNNISKSLKRIGPVSVYSHTQIITACKINYILIVLKFCVVLDHQLPPQVLIVQ